MSDTISSDDKLTLLQELLKKARAAGADSADALYVEGTSIAQSQRLGAVEKLERSEGQDLGLRVFVGKQQASVSSTELTPEILDSLTERAVAMAKAVPEDPFCGIADASEIATELPSIEMFDPSEPTAEVLVARATAAEDAARAVKGVTNSEGAEASWGSSSIWLATSNGFTGSYSRSSHSLSVSVLAGEGTDMERDYDWHSTVFEADLMDPELLGRNAGEGAVKRLGARSAATGQVPVIYDKRVSGGIVGHLLSAINGSSISRGTSFLKDDLGKAVMAENLNIMDDPLRNRGLRSKPFDGEGLPVSRRHLVENGALKTWILDLRSARQLGLSSTGHAARGTSGPPSPSTTNAYMDAGSESPEALIASIENGLYINELIGMGVNQITGDYSRGAGGYWIENGELTHPVTELTIAGNLRDMFKNMTPANDLSFRYGVDAPTLRIDGMMVAGS